MFDFTAKQIYLQSLIKANIYLDFDGCWLWLGNITNFGYARIYLEGQEIRVNRLSLFAFKNISLEKINKSCHSCNIKRCVNPDHLYNGNNFTNAEDRKKAGGYKQKTHCPKGHEYKPETTYQNKRTGKRYCKICRRIPNGYIAKR